MGLESKSIRRSEAVVQRLEEGECQRTLAQLMSERSWDEPTKTYPAKTHLWVWVGARWGAVGLSAGVVVTAAMGGSGVSVAAVADEGVGAIVASAIGRPAGSLG